MKKRTKIYILISILSVSVLLAVVRHFWNKLVPHKPKATESAILVVDRKTWKVIDPKNRKADLSKYNTPEAKRERSKATLALENPVEFRKQFPPTAEQLAREEEARRIITNPPTLQELLRTKTPERRKAFEESLDRMLNPRVSTPAE